MSNFGKERQTGATPPNVTKNQVHHLCHPITTHLNGLVQAPPVRVFLRVLRPTKWSRPGSCPTSSSIGPPLPLTQLSNSQHSSQLLVLQSLHPPFTISISIVQPFLTYSQLTPSLGTLSWILLHLLHHGVTPTVFVPQRGFTPQQKAGDERNQLGHVLKHLDKKSADHGAKTADGSNTQVPRFSSLASRAESGSQQAAREEQCFGNSTVDPLLWNLSP